MEGDSPPVVVLKPMSAAVEDETTKLPSVEEPTLVRESGDPAQSKPREDTSPPSSSGISKMTPMFLMCLVLIVIGQLTYLIVLQFDRNSENNDVHIVLDGDNLDENGGELSNVCNNAFFDIETVFDIGDNICAGKKPDWPNVDCVHAEGPQSGANVTKGYVGDFEVDHLPLTTPYWMNSMCPVNVHWHLGTEHYSVGEYDEMGSGPNGRDYGPEAIEDDPDAVQPGFRCRYYDENDSKFTMPYEWKHCKGMLVGETYEVHWPHSAAGACGTVDQYQSPFYDGVFCTDGVLVSPHRQVGVQAQIFTIVNDEEYFYADMMRGWIVDGEYGKDIHYYTGSTTGSSRSNEICSAYAPITWQVDRKCHLISASSFDKLCYDMKLQRDDMTDDLHAHGSRELVADHLAANNGQRHRRNRALRPQDTYSYRHMHSHDHDHTEWY